MTRPVELERFFARDHRAVRVELTRVQGSSPREAGTEMFVGRHATCGTIGGGQLEWLVIERARELLEGDGQLALMDVPLGPEIGQCCGGRVKVALERLDEAGRAAALERLREAERALPRVMILGAGHVGRALAELFQHLPVQPVVIDMRAPELDLCTAAVETKLSAIPEVDIVTAPAGSAFIVATHDHGLDFLLASAALQRGDAAYVGLIGSASKRARFASWCRDYCGGLTTEQLTCPIGAGGSRDKRPSVIAALVTAEVMTALTRMPDEASLGCTEPIPLRLAAARRH